MNFNSLLLYNVSSFVTTVICLTCSLLSITNSSKVKVNISFSIVSFIVGIWSFFNFLMFMLKGIDLSLNIGRIIYIFAIFLPPALYFFIFSTMNISNKNTRFTISILSIISFIFLLFIPSSMFIKDVSFNHNFYYIIPGYVYFAFMIYIFLSCVCSVILIIIQYQKTLVLKIKERLKILILAFFVVFIAIGMHIVVVYDSIIGYIPHNMFTVLFVVLMFYSMYRDKYLNIKKLVFFKISIYIITYSVGVGIPLYIVFMYEKISPTFIVLVITSIIIYLLMIYIQIEIEKFLFRKQISYQQLLSKTSDEMVSTFKLQEVCHIVVSLIMDMIKVRFISIFIYDTNKMKYICLDAIGEKTNTSIKFDITNHVVTYIKTKIKSFILDNENKQNFDIIGNDISVIIPIRIKEKLIGFIFVGNKKDDNIYSNGDLEIFNMIANQLAVSIQNIWFIQISVQQQEKLVKTEKLASIGGMTDGLAHQIKNRLNIFSLIGTSMKVDVELLKKNFDNFSSKEEFIRFLDDNLSKIPQAIIDNVKQILKLLQNILGFAKREENILQFETFSLKQIIQQVEQLIKLKHLKYRFLLSLNIPENDNIYAIKAQIQEILFNLIDNSVEATIAKKEYLKKSNNIDLNEYKPEIKISLKSFSDKWQLIIEDNGIGIKQKDKIKLFSAFFTTKIGSLSKSNSGSGIGVYIAKRMIVEAHNGTIIFESKYGEGTSFIITLPKIHKNSSH